MERLERDSYHIRKNIMTSMSTLAEFLKKYFTRGDLKHNG